MRTATLVVAFFALLGLASSQDICTPVLTCSTALSTVTVPAPYYALNFSTDPRPAGAVYGWAAAGANETGCSSSAFHAGVVQLMGSDHDTLSLGPSINLTAPFTDANSVSTPLPSATLFGTGTSLGSVIDGTAGWTIEVTFKALAQTQWSKIFDFGQGGGGNHDDVWFGYNWQNNWMSWSAYDENGNNHQIDYVVPVVVIGQWYTVVLVWQEMASGTADWFSYVDGEMTQWMPNNYFPSALQRESANLGRSDWQDSFFQGEIDTFNIYNYALTSAQVAALALKSQGGCSVSYGVPAPVTNATVPTPFFEATFDSDPRQSGVVANYGWEQQDADDVTCGLDSQHQGLLVLPGMYVPNVMQGSYVNLSESSGPNSIGQVLPIIGGPSSGSGDAAGWSFELTLKVEVVYPWAKFFDIAQPQNFSTGNICRQDLLMGFNGGSVGDAANAGQPSLQFDVCDGNGIEHSYNGWGSLQLGAWYNLVAVIQQSPIDATQAMYALYINGVRVGGAFGYYPEAVVRQNANLGKSSWGDSFFGGLIDTFRVYDYALNSEQVLTLSANALGSAGQLACPMSTNLPTVVPSEAIIYSLTFDSDPSAAAGGAENALYQWAEVDPSDSPADQALFKGVLILNGFVNTTYEGGLGPYVNLSSASGPASVGQVLPPIGTDTAGMWSQGSVGFTIELVVKMRGQQQWAKVYDLGAARNAPGSGSCNGDLVLGWLDVTNQLEFETCTDFGNGLNNRLIVTDSTTLGQYYHIVIVVQQSVTNEALAIAYVDGQAVGNVSIAYPYAEYRRDATLGHSDWDNFYSQSTAQQCMHTKRTLSFDTDLFSLLCPVC